MKRIIGAITSATLAFGLLAQGTPAQAAVAGYDSAYAGESAFLTLAPGEQGTFTVFFVNTGTATWTKSTASQVDLAACLGDKVTCDAQDASDTPFRAGWISGTRYATHTQTSVAPGQAATFTYSVRVPLSGVPIGLYLFNGALILASTGADIHNEGYFQQVEVKAANLIPDLVSLSPDQGSIAGGDNVVITGSNFVCLPDVTVKFGTKAATVLSCGSTSVTVTTPAATAGGDVDVVLTNPSGESSDKLTFTYVDDEAPTFDAVSAAGQVVDLTFSEPVCLNDDLTDPADVSIKVNGSQADWLESSVVAALCSDDTSDATISLSLDPADVSVVEGDSITVTITSAGAKKIEDVAGNKMAAARTRTATAGADTTAPTITKAEAVDDDELDLTASEPLDCTNADENDFTFDPTTGSNVDATAVDCDGNTLVLTFPSGTFADAAEGKIIYDGVKNEVEDLSGNDLADFTMDITPLEGSGAPIITSAKVDNTGGGFTKEADVDDVIKLVFSQEMTDPNDDASVILRVQDTDGTVADISCSGAATAANDKYEAECSFDDPRTGGTEDDATVIYIQLLEGAADDAAGDESVSTGDIDGLQWTATIIDSANFTSADDADGLDVDGSTDKSINYTTS